MVKLIRKKKKLNIYRLVHCIKDERNIAYLVSRRLSEKSGFILEGMI